MMKFDLPDGPLDKGAKPSGELAEALAVQAMWRSLTAAHISNEIAHATRAENAEATLRRVSEALSPAASIKVEATRTAPLADKLAALSDAAMMTHRDIAAKLGIDAESLRKRLDRWRKTNNDGWQEITERRPREPRYLYRIGAVRSVLALAVKDS